METETRRAGGSAQPILAVRGLTLRYAERRLIAAERVAETALRDVSLDLWAGKTLALVGSSGAGKSSLARCLVFLEQPASGQIVYRGVDLLTAARDAQNAARREIHLIFQDSASALNPRLTVREILMEPLRIHKVFASREESERRVLEVMKETEIATPWLTKRPLGLSGGQRQRVAIARSLVLRPTVLILDEALSALDLSMQNQIANLLLDLQEQHALAYLYITHDIQMAGRLAHKAAVLESGRIVMRGSPQELFTANLQITTQVLGPPSQPSETVAVPGAYPDK